MTIRTYSMDDQGYLADINANPTHSVVSTGSWLHLYSATDGAVRRGTTLTSNTKLVGDTAQEVFDHVYETAPNKRWGASNVVLLTACLSSRGLTLNSEGFPRQLGEGEQQIVKIGNVNLGDSPRQSRGSRAVIVPPSATEQLAALDAQDKANAERRKELAAKAESERKERLATLKEQQAKTAAAIAALAPTPKAKPVKALSKPTQRSNGAKRSQTGNGKSVVPVQPTAAEIAVLEHAISTGGTYVE